MKKKAMLMLAAHLITLGAMFLLISGSLGFVNAGASSENVFFIDTMSASVNGGPWEQVTLPHSFEDLPARTPVTLTASFYASPRDTVYIKSVYAPAEVYLNGKLCYAFGRQENYPGFMVDPATEVHMVEVGSVYEMVQLQIDFLSPASRRTLTVHPPIVGTSKEVILERCQALGIPLVLSLAQVIYGVSLIFISVCLQLVDKKGASFLWLGLVSLMTGLWAFGENNFSGMIFKNSTILYVLSFMGFFTFVIPLLRFTRIVVEFEDPRPVWYVELGITLCAGTALILQLTGILPMSTSMYFFHIALPMILIFLTVYTVADWLHHRNVTARRFVLPIGVLAVSAILELLNYKIYFTYVFSSLFQMGVLFFLLVMGVTAGLAMKDSMHLQNKKRQLAFEKGLMDIRIREQEGRDAILAQHEQMLSQQRHDLRHHLDAIMALAKDENAELQDYLRTLMANIPKSNRTFCENRAVSAVLGHYDALCRQKNIDLSLDLAVPGENPNVTDSVLCILFGNILENAVEACDRMESGERFIRVCTRMQHDLLVLTVDNSFNGQVRTQNGRFRSSKRDDYGIGLTSVQAMAQKYGGDARFEPNDTVFKSSVYVRL